MDTCFSAWPKQWGFRLALREVLFYAQMRNGTAHAHHACIGTNVCWKSAMMAALGPAPAS